MEHHPDLICAVVWRLGVDKMDEALGVVDLRGANESRGESKGARDMADGMMTIPEAVLGPLEQ